jgi:glycosyltransferase involved in cell wall biosynthesis
LTVSVVVPSYRRSESLERCLRALALQERMPDETVVVLRSSDTPSIELVNTHVLEGLRAAVIDEPGVLAAMRMGVSQTTGDVIAFTDDDAEPSSAWLAGLLRLIDPPEVGAAGGRDVIQAESSPRRTDVGRMTRYGKLVGNHHLGAGPVRDVDSLKGVNMAFRAECLALPRPGVLRGDGAEVYFEVMCSQWTIDHGWRVVYDPEVEVAHAAAQRLGEDQRKRPSRDAVRDASHNFLVATAALDRRRLPRQALYAIALGSRDAPGIVRGLLAIARREPEVRRRFMPSLAGSLLALARLTAAPADLSMVTCAELRVSQRLNAEMS